MKIDGGCHCGYITYEAEVDPTHVGICHCTDCQTMTGTAFRVNVRSREGSFRLLSGEPTIYEKTAESGNQRALAFCPRCGTPIHSTTVTDQKVHNIRAGTVRQRAGLKPTAMGWCRSARDWVMDLGAQNLRQSPKQPPV